MVGASSTERKPVVGKAVTTVASQGMMVEGVKEKGRLVLSNFPTTQLPMNDTASSSRHGVCLSRDRVITSREDVSKRMEP